MVGFVFVLVVSFCLFGVFVFGWLFGWVWSVEAVLPGKRFGIHQLSYSYECVRRASSGCDGVWVLCVVCLVCFSSPWASAG